MDVFGQMGRVGNPRTGEPLRIGTGEIVGKLPAERSLADEYEVSYVTVRRAMEVPRERGVIVTIHGRGTFVASSLPDPPGSP